MPNVLCICILSFAIHGERASKKTCAYSSMSLPVIVWCKMHQELVLLDRSTELQVCCLAYARAMTVHSPPYTVISIPAAMCTRS